mgnify:CR=1 FL=1
MRASKGTSSTCEIAKTVRNVGFAGRSGRDSPFSYFLVRVARESRASYLLLAESGALAGAAKRCGQPLSVPPSNRHGRFRITEFGGHAK